MWIKKMENIQPIFYFIFLDTVALEAGEAFKSASLPSGLIMLEWLTGLFHEKVDT